MAQTEAPKNDTDKIAELEAELKEAYSITAEDSIASVTKKIAQRQVLPFRIRALKVRHLKKERDAVEEELEPLRAERQEAIEAAEEFRVKTIEFQEERNRILGRLSYAEGRLEKRSRHHKELSDEIAALEGELNQ